MSPITVDSIERIFWTIIQAVVAILIVEIGDLEVWWAAVAMAVLVTVKTQVARYVGEPDAAIIPERLRAEQNPGS
jgi:hypothetical protein